MHNLAPLVLDALTNIDEGKSTRVALRLVVDNSELSQDEESLLYYFVFEIYRKLNLIDLYIKTSSSSFSLRKIRSYSKSILRFATHLLKIENRDINDVFEWLSPFYSKIKDLEFLYLLESIKTIEEEKLHENRDDLASELSLQYFLPTWVIRKFISQWGEEFTQQLLPSFLDPLPLYVRVNTLKTDLNQTLYTLRERGVELEEVKQIPNFFKVLKSPTPIPRTAEYITGKIIIQQKASAAVAHIIAPQESDVILDMCASPGGKTSHISSLVPNSKNIIAVDLNDERTRILRERLNLLNVRNVKIIQADARNLHIKVEHMFDKILLDPPCSGSGTYSSRPENRWRLKRKDLRWYVNLQWDLLQEAARLTKRGGFIVYSTCSLFHDENSDLINSFIDENPDFYLEESYPKIGLHTEIKHGIVQEIFPHLHDTEGFFIAKIKRKK
jgi:16S rRNA (cytosine967-C5)-methyltransferase